MPSETPFEVRETKDGKVFGIKNIRQKSDGTTITYTAEICGDEEAAQKYLETFVKSFTSSFKTIHFRPMVEDIKA